MTPSAPFISRIRAASRLSSKAIQRHGLQFKAPKSERGKRTIKLDDTLVALLVRMRERFQRVVAGAPDGADVDLSLVRVPDDWLIFPAPDGLMNG